MRLPSLPRCLHLPRPVPFLNPAMVCALLLAAAPGCAEIHSAAGPAPATVRAAPQQGQDAQPLHPGLLQQPVAPPTEEKLPPAKLGQPVVRLGFTPPDPTKVVPINLDTVLRLAETQNGQTAVAREKLEEAFANQDAAAKAWLPDLWVGAGWYRHDGGLSDFQGNLLNTNYSSMFAGMEISGRLDLRDAVYKKVEAERHVWQQRAELTKLNSEAFLEATTTYVDLLAARAAEAIALKIQAHLEDLLKQADSLAKAMPAAEVEVARVQTELYGQQLLLRKFREGAMAATAKLIYLLGLDPESELVIVDRHLVAFTLVQADVPTGELVAQAQQQGPGIRELEGLLHLIQEASAKDNCLSQMLPVFDVRMAEGGFGTGPGDSMDWANRFDFGVQMRWNLTEWVTHHERQRATAARIGQAHATFNDLRAKLSMGVQEAREAVLSARDQLDAGKKQVEFATDAYERSQSRLLKSPNVKERSPSEVLLSIRALNQANLAYLMAIRDQDKAQLRLAILTGAISIGCER